MSKPVSIIGAGPVGLAALAHCVSRNIEAELFEANDKIASAIHEWGNVLMFSPSGWNVDTAAASLLKANGWKQSNLPVYVKGHELIDDYLQPLADLPDMHSRIHLNHKVNRIEKADTSGFKLMFDHGDSAISDYVIDAGGTWFDPKKLAVFDESVNPWITYKIPSQACKKAFCEQSVAVIGMGDSAIASIFELDDMGCVDIHWLIPEASINNLLVSRKKMTGVIKANSERIETLDKADVLKVHTDFRVQSVCCKNEAQIVVESTAGEHLAFDNIIANIGFKPDLTIYDRLPVLFDEQLQNPPGVAQRLTGVREDPTATLNQLQRYNIEYAVDDLKLNIPNLFIVGIKSYGLRPGFLMKNGYNQIEVLIDYIANRIHSA